MADQTQLSKAIQDRSRALYRRAKYAQSLTTRQEHLNDLEELHAQALAFHTIALDGMEHVISEEVLAETQAALSKAQKIQDQLIGKYAAAKQLQEAKLSPEPDLSDDDEVPA